MVIWLWLSNCLFTIVPIIIIIDFSFFYFSPDVKLYDYIKEEVGARMVDRIYDLTKEIKTAAEIGTIHIQLSQTLLNDRWRRFGFPIPILNFSFIGCNRGFMSRHDLADTIGHLYLCELSPTMLEQVEVANGLNVTKLNMDEELPKVRNMIITEPATWTWWMQFCWKRFLISNLVRGEFIGYGRV